MVGDPGIEPGTSRLGGVTVRCRTLQHVAHWGGGIRQGHGGVKVETDPRGSLGLFACAPKLPAALSREITRGGAEGAEGKAP